VISRITEGRANRMRFVTATSTGRQPVGQRCPGTALGANWKCLRGVQNRRRGINVLEESVQGVISVCLSVCLSPTGAVPFRFCHEAPVDAAAVKYRFEKVGTEIARRAVCSASLRGRISEQFFQFPPGARSGGRLYSDVCTASISDDVRRACERRGRERRGNVAETVSCRWAPARAGTGPVPRTCL